MKGALTAVISALALGVLSAAEVSGSNSAIVVEKDVRESSTGWQLLCVPVDGFSIDGTAGTIDVNDFLPASYYNDGSKVYILNEDGSTPSTPSCTLSNGTWSGTTTTLSGGQSFWVRNPTTEDISFSSLLLEAISNGDTSTTADTIYFCGQERTRTTLERPTAGTISAMMNDGATAVTLNDFIESPKVGDEILVIKSKSKNYRCYVYDADSWWDIINNADVGATDTILPGEAFYYQSAK